MIYIIESTGGLFDFNTTLPLVALQFMLLTVLLTENVFIYDID